MHVLINGLSIGSGGGFTVGRMIHDHLAERRPDWRVTMVLSSGRTLHHEFKALARPANAEIHWAPDNTSSYLARFKYEKRVLPIWATEQKVDFVFQLNGMVIPTMKPPTFAHFQDPLPYRPEAWSSRIEPLRAWMKRRAHRQALNDCRVAGWTSGYLQDLLTNRLGVTPRDSRVLYNGIPEDWIERDPSTLMTWSERPMRILTVSNVNPYKRQELVIRVIAKLAEEGLRAEYHICGHGDAAYLSHLRSVADQLGVASQVHVEGRVSDERAVELFSSSRCFCLMSVCESFGIPAIEAMSFGTPVVVAKCCAIPEVCGDAAQLCPVDDLDALTIQIRESLCNKTLASSLIELGIMNVKRFRWSEIAERIALAIEENVGP